MLILANFGSLSVWFSQGAGRQEAGKEAGQGGRSQGGRRQARGARREASVVREGAIKRRADPPTSVPS